MRITTARKRAIDAWYRRELISAAEAMLPPVSERLASALRN
jgi:hypothetical protein